MQGNQRPGALRLAVGLYHPGRLFALTFYTSRVIYLRAVERPAGRRGYRPRQEHGPLVDGSTRRRGAPSPVRSVPGAPGRLVALRGGPEVLREEPDAARRAACRRTRGSPREGAVHALAGGFPPSAEGGRPTPSVTPGPVSRRFCAGGGLRRLERRHK